MWKCWEDCVKKSIFNRWRCSPIIRITAHLTLRQSSQTIWVTLKTIWLFTRVMFATLPTVFWPQPRHQFRLWADPIARLLLVISTGSQFKWKSKKAVPAVVKTIAMGPQTTTIVVTISVSDNRCRLAINGQIHVYIPAISQPIRAVIYRMKKNV